MRKLRAFVASLGKVLGGGSAARGDWVIRRGIWYQASRPTLRRSGWCRVSLSCAVSKALRPACGGWQRTCNLGRRRQATTARRVSVVDTLAVLYCPRYPPATARQRG